MKRRRRQGSKYESVRKIGKVGRYSYCITIPRVMIGELGWRERQRVVVTQEGDSIVIRDWKKPGKK